MRIVFLVVVNQRMVYALLFCGEASVLIAMSIPTGTTTMTRMGVVEDINLRCPLTTSHLYSPYCLIYLGMVHTHAPVMCPQRKGQ